jgi:preprotein translocase subunit YajC
VSIVILFAYVVIVLGVFYFFMLRPQRRKRAAQRAMVAAVQKGDEIVTVDGLCGTVRQVQDSFVIVEIADRKQVRLVKSALSQVVAK